MVAELSEIYHASLRAISFDKPLPDESGFWNEPPTPCPSSPYSILYTDNSRPLRPSDFPDVSTTDLPCREKNSSTESTSTDLDGSSSTETLPLMSPFAWVTVLTVASVTCLLALVCVVFVSEHRLKALTPTPDEGGIFIDPIEFVAKGGPHVPSDGGEVSSDEATVSASPEAEVTERTEDHTITAMEPQH